MLKKLMLKPRETGDPKIDKAFSIVRHALTMVGSLLIALNYIDADQADISMVLDILSNALDGTYGVIGLLGVAWATVSGWFSK